MVGVKLAYFLLRKALRLKPASPAIAAMVILRKAPSTPLSKAIDSTVAIAMIATTLIDRFFIGN